MQKKISLAVEGILGLLVWLMRKSQALTDSIYSSRGNKPQNHSNQANQVLGLFLWVNAYPAKQFNHYIFSVPDETIVCL